MSFRNKVLIPNISSIGGWKKYFSIDIFRIYGYMQRLREIYSALKSSYESTKSKKIVMGVIGKDTIGYWRDIQQIYKNFFGIECRGCREAIKRIAMGIPLGNVVDSVKLVFRNSELIRGLDSIYKVLDSVMGIVDVKGENRISIEDDLNRLSGNPLYIFDLLRGLYSTMINILPLYNEYTLFLEITRTMPMKLYSTFFKGFDFSVLRKVGIVYGSIDMCKDQEYRIMVHDIHSIGNNIDLLVDEIYDYIDFSRESLKTKMVRLHDERTMFVENMTRLISDVYELLDIKNIDKFYNDLNRYSYRKLVRARYSYLELKIRVDKEADHAVLGESIYKCEQFIDLLSPYIILGLGWIDSINEKNHLIKGVLHIYISNVR